MKSGSKLNPERLTESPFISFLITRAGQTTQTELALTSLCSNICPFQPYFSPIFWFFSCNEDWNLRRYRAPLASIDFTGTWWAFTLISVTFSCFQIFRERPCFLLPACQEPLASQTWQTEIIPAAIHLVSHAKILALYDLSHECHSDKIRHCVYEVQRAKLGTGFTLWIPCISQENIQAEHDHWDTQTTREGMEGSFKIFSKHFQTVA